MNEGAVSLRLLFPVPFFPKVDNDNPFPGPPQGIFTILNILKGGHQAVGGISLAPPIPPRSLSLWPRTQFEYGHPKQPSQLPAASGALRAPDL